MRSNRPLTRFACDHLSDAISRPRPISFTAIQGNTVVSSIADGMYQKLAVDLFGSRILELDVNEFCIHSIKVHFGSVYAGDGSPTKTTIERLNGILELLGSLHAIPEGVRIFRCRDTGSCVIGKDDVSYAVGEKHYRGLLIKPIKSSLEIDGYTLESGLVYWR